MMIKFLNIFYFYYPLLPSCYAAGEQTRAPLGRVRSGQGSLNVNSKLFTDDILESNILGPYFEMMETYKEFLSTLSSEQLCCLFNIIGFGMLLGILSSINFILFGEYLIKYFNIEERFPKIAKYIRLRQTANKYYLIFNIYLRIKKLIVIFT